MKILRTNPRFFYYFLWTSLLCVFVSSFSFVVGVVYVGTKTTSTKGKKMDLALKFRGPHHPPAQILGSPFCRIGRIQYPPKRLTRTCYKFFTSCSLLVRVRVSVIRVTSQSR